MNLTSNRLPTEFLETGVQIRRVVRAAIIMALGAGSTTLFYGYMALQFQAWQLTLAAAVAGLHFLTCLTSIGLARRGRPTPGGRLVISGYLVSFLLFSLVTSNFGLIFAAASILLTLFLAGQLLSRRSAQQVLISSVVLSVVMLLPDFMFPVLPALVDYRYLAPAAFYTHIPVILGILVIIYGYFTLRRFPSYSLQTKLVVAFLVVALTSLGLLTAINNWTAQRTLTDAANEKLLGAAKQTAASVEAFIAGNLDTIRAEAQLPILVDYMNLPPDLRAGSAAEAQASDVLVALRSKDRHNISSYGLLDLQGVNVLDTYISEIGTNHSNQDYFTQPAQTGRPFVSPIEFVDAGGAPAIHFSAPVHNSRGTIIGVLRVRYNASALQRLILQNNGLAGQESFAILLDENYIRLGHGSNPGLNFKAVVPLEAAKLAELKQAKRLPDWPAEKLYTNLPDFLEGLSRVDTDYPYFTAEGQQEVADDRGLEQIAAVKLRTKPWIVAFAQPQKVFLTPLQAQIRLALLLTMFVAALVALAAMGIGRYLAGPIIRLTRLAQRIAGGDLTARASQDSQDEIGQLAAAFNAMANRLQELIGSLEEQVRERTVELSLSMEVGQRAATIRDLSELLTTITHFIQQRFNLYYTQIYFIDDTGENLVLQAGTGEVGEKLLSRRHSLVVGGRSIVGRVASTAQPIVVSDTTLSDIHQPNELLPETQSELAIPLIVEGEVIGVLDMQANQTNTFTPSNLTVFEAMATQLAISIDSARQWALAQEAQQKAEEALKQLTHVGWTRRLASYPGGTLGFAYNLSTISPLHAEPETNDQQALSAPVLVQQQPVGQLSVELPPNRTWGQDERALVEAVAQHLAQKAENLRLFEITQERAAREQVARQITDKVRDSRNIESALRTAAEELARALGTSKAVIDLQLTPQEGADTAAEAGTVPNGPASIGQNGK